MFTNALEGLVKAKIASVEARLKAVDANHNGLSDLTEIAGEATAAFAALKVLEAKVTPAEIATALNLLFPGKFTTAEVVAGETALDRLAAAIAGLPALVEVVKKAL